MSDITKFPSPAGPLKTGVTDYPLVTLEILESPTPQQVVDLMLSMSSVINRQLGLLLAKNGYTIANPACQGLTAAGSSLEQGVMGFAQWMQQMELKKQQASGMVMPGSNTKPFTKN